jgi:hypothetical protein
MQVDTMHANCPHNGTHADGYMCMPTAPTIAHMQVDTMHANCPHNGTHAGGYIHTCRSTFLREKKMRGKAKEISAASKMSYEACDERRIKHSGTCSAKQHIVNVFRWAHTRHDISTACTACNHA